MHKSFVMIVIDAKALLAIFALFLVLGWIEGRRRSADFATIEAQNAQILKLLQGAEITQEKASTLTVL